MSMKPVMRDWRDIASKIRAWLSETKTKQEELAIMMGHADGSELSRYMNGKKPWYPPNLEKVAEIIGIEPEQFYYWPTPAAEWTRATEACASILERHLNAALAEIRALKFVDQDGGSE